MPVSQPTILAIETSTSACSAALLHRGQATDLCEVGNNIHSKVLLSMVGELVERAGITVAELDAVAVGQGPGSFTGLRIGVGVAQGIAFGAGCPMIGVSSLEALAQSLLPVEKAITVLAGIDARMGEIYWAEIELVKNSVANVSEFKVTSPAEVMCSAKEFTLIGNAWPEYWATLDQDMRLRGSFHDAELFPQAKQVLLLAERKYVDGVTEKAASFAPIYVRNDVAKKSNKPLPGKRI